jgi:hypothetical protein
VPENISPRIPAHRRKTVGEMSYSRNTLQQSPWLKAAFSAKITVKDIKAGEIRAPPGHPT